MRRFFRLAVLAAFSASLAACGGHGSGPVAVMPQSAPGSVAGPDNTHGGTLLTEPPEVHAVHGVATVSLETRINVATEQPAFFYNGEAGVAPTIRVKPGDTIVLDLQNSLAGGRGLTGDMNLHFHGLTVSPKKPADDVLTMLAMPGGTLHYVIEIPKVQEPGLYWYHPHVHGITDLQVGLYGMSGAIVITGLEHHLPGLAKMKERLLVVRDRGLADIDANAPSAVMGSPARTVSNADTDMSDMDMGGMDMPAHHRMHVNAAHPCGPDPGYNVSINDAPRPLIPIEAGESQFFRIVNATGHKTLKVALEGQKLELVALDGVALDAYPGTPPTEMVSSIVLPPAARAEFVVTGTGVPDKLRTLCYNTGPSGDPDPREVLATLAPGSQHPSRALGRSTPPQLRVGEPLPASPFSQPLPPVAAKRIVVLNEGDNKMFINGKAFSIKAPPMFTVHTGTVEEWHILNKTDEIHDFHIHQTHFFIESINGVPVAHPNWADSVVVPHRTIHSDGTTTPGRLVLLMDFRNSVIKGTFVFHCHILDHEDAGMMAKIRAI